jgi:hypothetical protein
LAQDVEMKKAELVTSHFLNLKQDTVGCSQNEKWAFKYVIHILKEKDRVTEEPALALIEEG